MGQQQLLLIILGVIIVGIAVAVGITMFQDNALSSNRDAVQTDLATLAVKAQEYFRKPASLGGGGNSFAGLTADSAGIEILVSTAFAHNANGDYSVKTAGTATQVIFEGVGKTAIDASTFPTYDCTVTASGYNITKVH